MAIQIDIKGSSVDELRFEKQRLLEKRKGIENTSTTIFKTHLFSFFVVSYHQLIPYSPSLILLYPILGSMGMPATIGILAGNILLGRYAANQVPEEEKINQALRQINEELKLRNRPWYVITAEKIFGIIR